MPRVKKEIARPSRLKLMLRRQRRNLRLLAWGMVSFGVVMVALAMVQSAARGGAVARLETRFARAIDMRVQDIVVSGRANTPEPLLREALGVSRGDPILGFSVGDARDRIESLSWVEHVAVERRLPGTIFVDLTERRPFAVWQYQGKFQLIDRAGQVVANEDVASFSELPLVVGLGAPAHAVELLDALEAAPIIHALVAASVRVGGRRWNLQLKNGITVMLPEGHEAAALQRLTDLQTTQSLLDRPLVFVDLRLPDRMAVRAKPGAMPAPDAKPHDPQSPEAKPAENPNRRAT